MRKKIKDLLRLALAVLAVFLLYRSVDRYIGIKQADVIARTSYNGLILVGAKYKYYAVNSKRAYKVSKKYVEEEFGDGSGEWDSIKNKYAVPCWYAELIYSNENGFRKDRPYLMTSFGDQYHLYYWDYNEIFSDENIPKVCNEDLRIMRLVAENQYDGKASYFKGPQTWRVFSFILFRNKENYLIEVEDGIEKSLFRVAEDGNLVKVMDDSKDYRFDYYYFR